MTKLFSTGAKTAVSSAQQELVAATAEYDDTNQKLKELVVRAPGEGCKAEVAEAIIGDMHTAEAELGLGVLLTKAVTAGAELVEGSMSSCEESKDKIQK